MSQPATLAEILASASDVLFPEFLGEKVIEVNSRSASDDTPLHVMAWRQDSASASVLIAAGADVNAVGDMGETPLHVAMRVRDWTLAAMLVRAGARTDIRSEFGETANDRCGGVMDWLRSQGAELDCCD